MRSLFRNLRGGLSAPTALGVFLSATLALSVYLGYEALSAAASHRRTAEEFLRSYALISATEFARISGNNLDDVLDDVFEPVFRRRRGTPLPPPDALRRELASTARAYRCECPTFREPLALIRLDPAAGTSEVVPDTLAPTTVAFIADRVLAQRPARGRMQLGLFSSEAPGATGGPLTVAYMVSEDGEGLLEAAYAMVLAPTALGELAQRWFEGRQILPQPIAGDLPNDSLLQATILEPGGHAIFTSAVGYPEAVRASVPLGLELGGLIVQVAVRPDAASQLIIGGLPSSRIPLLVLLLLLTLGVGAAAFTQLRREHAFQRLREDFVSGVSHELRTPLAQIRMFAELQEAGKLSTEADRRRAVSVIHRESRRLSHLVENILQFSRLRRAGQGLPRERLDLAEALAEGIDAVTPLLEDRQMHLDVLAQPGLPVLANRDAMTRIVVNLLDNAVKYGPKGQTIRLGVERVNGTARLTVSDEGPGVPASERERVWKAYRRLDRDVKARVPGTGIGLSVVSELAQQHGGRVSVEDSTGRGARFVIELPLAQTESPAGHRNGAA